LAIREFIEELAYWTSLTSWIAVRLDTVMFCQTVEKPVGAGSEKG
jgi:hypothetical protein